MSKRASQGAFALTSPAAHAIASQLTVVRVLLRESLSVDVSGMSVARGVYYVLRSWSGRWYRRRRTLG